MWERSTDEHNGHPNFETWAFWTHVTQTETLLNRAFVVARPYIDRGHHPAAVGKEVIDHFKEWAQATTENYTSNDGDDGFDDARLMTHDVGSWWRVDDNHIGHHLVDYYRDAHDLPTTNETSDRSNP